MVTLPRERMCVLVADDEAPARQRLIDLLRKDCDVPPSEAANGQAAVEVIRNSNPTWSFSTYKCLNSMALASSMQLETTECHSWFLSRHMISTRSGPSRPMRWTTCRSLSAMNALRPPWHASKGASMNAARGNSDSAFFAWCLPRHQPIAVSTGWW